MKSEADEDAVESKATKVRTTFIVQLLRDEVVTEAMGLFPVLIIFLFRSIHPLCAHVRTLSMAQSMIVAACIGFSILLVKIQSNKELKEMGHSWNDCVHHFGRTVCHASSLAYARDDEFLKLLFLFVAPVDAARLSRNLSFKVYMTFHFFLVFLRYWGDLSAGVSYIVCSVAVAQMLFDVSAMKRTAEEQGVSLALAHHDVAEIAQKTVKEVMEVFCEASAVVSADGALLEASPTLGTFLGRQAPETKEFSTFLEMEDRKEYQEFLATFSSSASSSGEQQEGAKGNRQAIMKLRSISVHLLDCHQILVKVNVWHACFYDVSGETRFYLGISESWHPKESKKAHGRRARGSSADNRRMNWETGKMESTTPMYPEGFEDQVKGLNDASQPTQRRRASSPRPSKARANLDLGD